MISDPAIIEAIDNYFASGGEVHRYPFGFSGIISPTMLYYGAHYVAFIQWARRFGYDALPDEALDLLLKGRLAIVQVRAPLVWKKIKPADNGLPLWAITEAMQCSETGVRRALELLESHRLALAFRHGRFMHYRALGESVPQWRTFMSETLFRTAHQPQTHCAAE